MNLPNLFAVILFILALVYLVMGLIAYSHTLEGAKADKLLAISPWWAAYSSIYDEFGRKLSNYGKVILFVEMVGFFVWVAMKGG